MKLIIDTREQTPLAFTHLDSTRGTLQSGDYSLEGLEEYFAIERKSITDLCGSLKSGRERFKRELHRLRGFDFKRILIVGTIQQLQTEIAKGRANFKMLQNSLLSIAAEYDVPAVRVDTEEEAALLVESWAFMYARKIAAMNGEKLSIPAWVIGDVF